MSEMDEIVKEFLVESNENIDQVDRDLIELEGDPTSKELLGRIFRTMHSIKGATGFLDFSKLGAVTHAGETLLSLLRDGRLTLNAEITSGLLSLTDVIRNILSEIAVKGRESDTDHTGLIETLMGLQAGVRVDIGSTRSILPALMNSDAPMRKPNPANVTSPRESTSQPAPRPTGIVDTPSVSGQIEASLPNESELLPNESYSQSLDSVSIRVDVNQLDMLMDLVGELVLARNQILQMSSHQQDPDFIASSQHLNLITSELQERVARTRMQPIDNIWNKLPRLVRDLTTQCHKKVQLQMRGKETELDKSILEALKDPLTHVVRNAIDHGIESPEMRLAAGKSVEGSLILHAFHENGQVNVEISDDGAGINLDRIKQKAVDLKLITLEEASSMEDRDALGLLFIPGFSTARAITNISGRGVGMDVVKTNIEKVGGTVEIENRPGLGTNIRIRIPLTLAILSALIFTVGETVYAIPQQDIVELIRLDEMAAKGQINSVQGVMLYRLRGQLLPLVNLDAALNVTSAKSSNAGRTAVVLQAHHRQFGLVVGEVADIAEIVVKPLGKHLKSLPIYAGATILGDGRVALILDVLGLARRVSIITDVQTEDATAPKTKMEGPVISLETLLVFEDHQERVAIPLSEITRLEEFPLSALETTDGWDVVQYREEILQLISIPNLSEEARLSKRSRVQVATSSDKIQVVVCRKNGHQFGVVVDHILDIVEHKVARVRIHSRSGHETAVISGRVTRILEMDGLVRDMLLPNPSAVVMEV